VLGAGPVYDAMMAGQSFRGEAVILGTPYYTAYQPVFSTGGDVIGIIYVGVERAKIVAVRNQVITVMAWSAFWPSCSPPRRPMRL
jgi:methyl-accepting chemotaxis protein